MLLSHPVHAPDIPLERQQRWFKGTFDHLLAITESAQASEAGVLLSSGYCMNLDSGLHHKNTVQDKEALFHRRYSFHVLQIMFSNISSFSYFSRYQVFKEVPSIPKPYWADIVFGFRTMTDREMKRFPNFKFGQAVMTLKCESLRYLPWLEKR